MTVSAKDVLIESKDQLKKAIFWLERSEGICQSIDFSKVGDKQLDDLESLGSRFARANHILINKVFRNIDHFELVDGGSLIDVINRAAKRGLITDEETGRQYKELRNRIAHEYEQSRLVGLYETVLKFTPGLRKFADATITYIEEKAEQS